MATTDDHRTDPSTNGRNTTDRDGYHELPPELLALPDHLKALWRLAQHYLGVKRDKVVASVRRSLLLAALGLAAATVALVGLATAGVLVVIGIAGALTAWLNAAWLGNLLAGLLILFLAAIVSLITLSMLRRHFARQRSASYARKRRDFNEQLEHHQATSTGETALRARSD